MEKQTRLTPEERAFFALVKQAIFANPFGSERPAIDAKIASDSTTDAGAHAIEQTVDAVERRLGLLQQSGCWSIEHFSQEDRSLVEGAHLFVFFYRFRKKFDQHIAAQTLAEDKPVKLEFAGEAVAFLQKRGFGADEIQRAVELAYQFRRAYGFIRNNLIGRSQAMRRLRHDLWNGIFTHDIDLYRRYLWNRMEDFTTLILGETGSGKGSAANAIGQSGYIPFDLKKQRFAESFTNSFLSINLSQFPETLIESELFGHKKGSFTGAVQDHRGVFERCSKHGVILLDEIGEIARPIQIKLLQVLQDRVFYPVGSRKQERFSGRVIAATNRPLEELRRGDRFRDDFYYRLCSDIITVPSLRQRLREEPAELDDLLAVTVKRMVGQETPELVERVRNVIVRQLGADYPWYGNVRELEQCVRRVLVRETYEGDKTHNAPDLQSRLMTGIELGNLSAQDLMSGYCKLLYERYGTYEEVARRTELDRRTVTKHIREWRESS
jgi:DNA-binding NtrC family response regulator